MNEFLAIFTQFGLPGLVIGLQFLWIWRQERRLKVLQTDYRNECDARVADAAKFLDLALKLQKSTFDAVGAISNKVKQEQRHERNMQALIAVLQGKSVQENALDAAVKSPPALPGGGSDDEPNEE